MEPIYKGLTKEKKEELNKRGYKEFEYYYPQAHSDPDEIQYFIISAAILAASIYGRQLARKNNYPTTIFSMNILLLPLFHFWSFQHKHINKFDHHYRKRPNFNELLEHYPVTRRAWKKALILREQEMIEIKSKLKNSI